MKNATLSSLIFLLLCTLSACSSPMHTSTTTASTPSLSAPSRATSRLPSPGNYQRSTLMQSSTMTVPQ